MKNGLHCAFAHGSHDHRPPVYDIKEIQALEAAEADGSGSANGPNALDKERNLMNEDPKWQGESKYFRVVCLVVMFGLIFRYKLCFIKL